MKGFINFIKEKGVAGLAVGFIMGSAVSKLVSSFVSDIANPLLGIFLGAAGDLTGAYISLGPAKIMWGNFIVTFIDFLIIALVVYIGVTLLRLNSKKENK